VGGECEYSLLGVNGKLCGKAEVQLNAGNDRCWPN